MFATISNPSPMKSSSSSILLYSLWSSSSVLDNNTTAEDPLALHTKTAPEKTSVGVEKPESTNPKTVSSAKENDASIPPTDKPSKPLYPLSSYSLLPPMLSTLSPSNDMTTPYPYQQPLPLSKEGSSLENSTTLLKETPLPTGNTLEPNGLFADNNINPFSSLYPPFDFYSYLNPHVPYSIYTVTNKNVKSTSSSSSQSMTTPIHPLFNNNLPPYPYHYYHDATSSNTMNSSTVPSISQNTSMNSTLSVCHSCPYFYD